MQIYEIVLGVILFLMAAAVILCITAQGRSEKAGVFMGGTQMRGKRTEPGAMMRTLTTAMVCAGGAVILLLDILAAHI